MNNQKTTLLRAFNNHFFDFLNDIIDIFPENTDIKNSKESFETIKRMNPSAIIKVWNTYIYNTYKTQIDNGDIDFFFDKDYANDLSGLQNIGDITQIIDSIRGPLKSMSDANKAHSAKYIQNLSKLSVGYTECA
jgi:hypothetical protein